VNVWLLCHCHVVVPSILRSLIVPLCSPRGCCVVLAVSQCNTATCSFSAVCPPWEAFDQWRCCVCFRVSLLACSAPWLSGVLSELKPGFLQIVFSRIRRRVHDKQSITKHWFRSVHTCLYSWATGRNSSHQVLCNIPTFEALLRKYTYLFLERCRKSNNVWLRALMQSYCLYSSLFFEHYNRILLCDWVIELCSVRLIDGVPSHNAFAVYLYSTNLGISALFRSSAVTSVTC